MNIPTMHLVEVKYYGATNTRGARIKLHSPRLKETVWLAWPQNFGWIATPAIKHLEKLGHPILGIANTKDGYAILCGAVNNEFVSISGRALTASA